MGFSKDFIWGAATASYQVEGAAYADGKGLSVWDMCSKKPGFVKDGDTGDVACDHYHRYVDDVGLMKQIGLQAYRFSISWPRVLPDGVGKVNQKGLEFYDKLTDELLKNGITPYVTLFHWDYPYELYKKGGWLNAESSDWFAEYTKVVVDKLSDRVKHWMTLNEPQCYCLLGHMQGEHAPGLKLDKPDVFTVIHNSLLAHGKAASVIRTRSKQPCEIGYAPVGATMIPDTHSKEDVDFARKFMFSCHEQSLWANSWWMDPVFLGEFPADGLKAYEKWLPKIGQDDLKIIHQPMDFFGCNIYQGMRISSKSSNPAEMFVKKEVGYPQTTMKWPVTPEALYWGPKFFYERYQKPILITENGMANPDWVSVDKQVHDPQRIDYLYRYIREFKKAKMDGVDTKGYFAWTFFDNFEWAFGYNERFGIVHVDFNTLERTIKDSGFWYKDVIESNGNIIV